MVSLARWTVLAMTAGFVFSCATQVSAWGDDGHRIVCRIAFRLLDQKRQEKIVELTKAYRRPNNGTGFGSFEQGCLFADEARWKARDNLPGWDKFDPFDTWHFLNVPRTTHLVENSHCDKNCVLTGIAQHTEGLKAADVLERAEALLFLGHWIGDIHQPLHVSYSEDKGGNDINVSGGFYPPAKMHGVWDTQIIKKAVGADGWGPVRGPSRTGDHAGRARLVDRRHAPRLGAGVLQHRDEARRGVLLMADRQGRADLQVPGSESNAHRAVSGRVERRRGAAAAAGGRAAGRGAAPESAPARRRMILCLVIFWFGSSSAPRPGISGVRRTRTSPSSSTARS